MLKRRVLFFGLTIHRGSTCIQRAIVFENGRSGCLVFMVNFIELLINSLKFLH